MNRLSRPPRAKGARGPACANSRSGPTAAIDATSDGASSSSTSVHPVVAHDTSSTDGLASCEPSSLAEPAEGSAHGV